MRKGTRGNLFVILGVFRCFGLIHAEARDEKNQQTFVVRYKNGEQTIPVTVVLDYKKQTEYVINMSPRATTKTVTLYDFKQKTVAYKDLSNRECFLRQLTHETLNEETDALNRVQNPVEHQPKILSLDPHRSSLTPTEIRNMAGQKTAVFCRKMNTWLILPREAHNIQKRDVDEIDERTFHRHGYHTVQYSHYGRETRRRYRNPNRSAARHLSLKRKDASEIANEKFGNSEIRLPLEDNTLLPKHSSTQDNFSSPEHLGIPINEKNTPSSFGHQIRSEIHGKEGIPPVSAFRPPSIAENLNYGSILPTSYPNYVNRLNEQDLKSPLSSDIYSAADIIGNKAFYAGKEILPNTPGKDISVSRNSAAMNFASENPEALYVLKNETRNQLNISNNSFEKPNRINVEEKFSVEPFYKAEFAEPNTIPSKNQNHDFPLIGEKYDQRAIESESIPYGYIPSVSRNSYPIIPNEHNPDDPDVSTNVLEIPKIRAKFENLHSIPIAQTNEDVHDVFEGFFNLGKKPSPSGQEDLHNSFFIPSDPIRRSEQVQPNGFVINNYPASPLAYNNNTNINQQWRGSRLNFPNSDEIASTEYPSFSTNAYKYNEVTTPPNYLNLITNPPTTETYTKVDVSGPNNFLPLETNHRSSLKSKYVSNTDRNEESDTAYSTMVNANTLDHKHDNHRSDIPTDSDPTEYKTFGSSKESPQNINVQRPTYIPTNVVHEGIPSHQVRFQNVLRNYKPDEIVINVEKIPTQHPPESTSEFRAKDFPSNKFPNRRTSPHPVRPFNRQRSEQTSGGIWRDRPTERVTHPNLRTNNLQTPYRNGISFHTKKNNLFQHHRRNETNNFQNREYNSNTQQQRLHNLPYQQLNGLPPGVSIHPRHPKAPYADMFHPNTLQSMPQGNGFRALKPHRQRHHRKKDRFANSCCRTHGKSNGNGNLATCCRAGGSCCAYRDRGSSSKVSCCSSTKYNSNGQLTPPRQTPALIPNKTPVNQIRKTAEDHRDRCQKEKMCRTLYESTQQVMVCRNANIDGC